MFIIRLQTFCRSSIESRSSSLLFIRQNLLRNCMLDYYSGTLTQSIVPLNGPIQNPPLLTIYSISRSLPLPSPPLNHSLSLSFSLRLVLLRARQLARFARFATSALIPISRNYSFDQTKSVHDAPSRSHVHTRVRSLHITHTCKPRARSYIVRLRYTYIRSGRRRCSVRSRGVGEAVI